MKPCLLTLAVFLIISPFAADVHADSRVRRVARCISRHLTTQESWRRVIHKPADPEEFARKTHAWGTLVETDPIARARIFRHPFMNTYQWVPRQITSRIEKLGGTYDFKPILRTRRLLEKHILPQGRQFSLPVLIGTSLVTFPYYYRYTLWSVPERVTDLVKSRLNKKDREKALKTIREDFRCAAIQEKLQAGELAEDQALAEYAKLKAAFEKFAEIEEEARKNPPQDPLSFSVGLITDSDLQPIFGELIPIIEGKLRSRKTPLSDKQVLSIMDLELQAIFQTRLVNTWFLEGRSNAVVGDARAFRESLEKSADTKGHMADYYAGKLTGTQLASLLSGQIYLQTREAQIRIAKE